MKRNPRPNSIALFTAACCALLLGACATAPGDEPRPGEVQARPPGETTSEGRSQAVKPTPVPGVGLASGTTDAAGAPNDTANAPSKRTIYFDYDRFEIKDEYRPIVQAHAKYLRANIQARMLVQGHADERGSREYNIGLGQRRADSVKNMLTLLGGQEKQIESVSLGEEKPVCTDHAESCWSQNRRVQIRYVDEY
jgi:peptidoglycan-associated lipoprotein